MARRKNKMIKMAQRKEFLSDFYAVTCGLRTYRNFYRKLYECDVAECISIHLSVENSPLCQSNPLSDEIIAVIATYTRGTDVPCLQCKTETILTKCDTVNMANESTVISGDYSLISSNANSFFRRRVLCFDHNRFDGYYQERKDSKVPIFYCKMCIDAMHVDGGPNGCEKCKKPLIGYSLIRKVRHDVFGFPTAYAYHEQCQKTLPISWNDQKLINIYGQRGPYRDEYNDFVTNLK